MTKGLVKEGAVYFGTTMVNAAIPFFLLPILARALSPAEFGTVSVFQASITLIGAFVGLNIQGAITVQFFKDSSTAFRQFITVTLMILFCSTIFAGVVVLFGSDWLGRWTNLSLSWLLVAVLVSACQFIMNVRLVIWQVQHKPLHYGLFQIALTSLNAGLSLYLVLILQWGEEGRMWAISIAGAAFAVIGLTSLQVSGQLHWKWNSAKAREALRFGVPLVPHTLGGIVVGLADRFIITKRLGIEATGLYFVALQLSLPMAILGDCFNRAFLPWLFSKLAAGKKIEAILASYVTIVGFFFVGLGYLAVATWGMPMIVGEKYSAMRHVTAILILGGIMQACYYAVVNYIYFAKKPLYLSSITVGTGALYLIGAWYVCGDQGLVGLSLWFTAIQALIFLSVFAVAVIVIPMPWFAFNALFQEIAKYSSWKVTPTQAGNKNYLEE